MSGEVELSLLLPVYNEVESLPVRWSELAEVLPGLAGPAEVIVVDDGSTDGSDDVLRRLAKDDQRIGVIRFAENTGLSAALYAGLQAARAASSPPWTATCGTTRATSGCCEPRPRPARVSRRHALI